MWSIESVLLLRHATRTCQKSGRTTNFIDESREYTFDENEKDIKLPDQITVNDTYDTPHTSSADKDSTQMHKEKDENDNVEVNVEQERDAHSLDKLNEIGTIARDDLRE